MPSSQARLDGALGLDDLRLLLGPIILHVLRYVRVHSNIFYLLFTCLATPIEYSLWDDRGNVLFIVVYSAIA